MHSSRKRVFSTDFDVSHAAVKAAIEDPTSTPEHLHPKFVVLMSPINGANNARPAVKQMRKDYGNKICEFLASQLPYVTEDYVYQLIFNTIGLYAAGYFTPQDKCIAATVSFYWPENNVVLYVLTAVHNDFQLDDYVAKDLRNSHLKIFMNNRTYKNNPHHNRRNNLQILSLVPKPEQHLELNEEFERRLYVNGRGFLELPAWQADDAYSTIGVRYPALGIMTPNIIDNVTPMLFKSRYFVTQR